MDNPSDKVILKFCRLALKGKSDESKSRCAEIMSDIILNGNEFSPQAIDELKRITGLTEDELQSILASSCPACPEK